MGNAIPWWLRRLGLVRAELRGTRFPHTAEEGLRQCAELSAVAMELLKDEVRKSLRSREGKRVEMEACRLAERFSLIAERWKAARREEDVTPEGHRTP
ncbi:MAG: hypothetical protein ACLFVT_09025 [Syntrophobacteria bacterium]